MPLLGSVDHASGAADSRTSRSNSAQRVRALHETLTVSSALAGALVSAAGPVLLVDDLSESGWTLAVATRLLRRAGAQGVFPLVLAVQT
jgi:ATP-dependent DNA helicase RecQ